jgi:hypothetical protein
MMAAKIKGKGRHEARKKKYAANPTRVISNKKRRAYNHARRLEKTLERLSIRETLLERVLSSLGIKKAALKRLIGTLNIRRLGEVEANKYLASAWFQEREVRRREKRYVHRHKTKPVEQGTEGISGSTNPSDGNT